MDLVIYKFMSINGIRHSVNTETGELEVWNTKRHIEPITKATIVCNETLREYALSLGVKDSTRTILNTPYIMKTRYSNKVLMIVSKLKYLNILFISSNDLDSILETSKGNRNRVLKTLQSEGILQEYSPKGAREKNTYKIVFHPFIAYSGYNIITSVRHYVSMNSLDREEALARLTDLSHHEGDNTPLEHPIQEAPEALPIDLNTKLNKQPSTLTKLLQVNDAVFSLWFNKIITTEQLLSDY